MSAPQTRNETVVLQADSAVIGAISLALAAGADARTKVKVIEAIMRHAVLPEGSDTRPVGLLVTAIREARATFEVTDAKPKGRIRKEKASA